VGLLLGCVSAADVQRSSGSAPPLNLTLAGPKREARNDPRVKLSPMLPTHAIDSLPMTVTTAVDFAAVRKVTDGCAGLVGGLHRPDAAGNAYRSACPPSLQRAAIVARKTC
jgi:hypothetical protein